MSQKWKVFRKNSIAQHIVHADLNRFTSHTCGYSFHSAVKHKQALILGINHGSNAAFVRHKHTISDLI